MNKKMHTESYNQVFLELLRAGMWGREPQIAQNFEEWGSVVRLAKSQSVLGVVGQVMLTDEDLVNRIPQELKVRIKQFVMFAVKNMDLSMQIITKTPNFVTTMQATVVLQDIPAIPTASIVV